VTSAKDRSVPLISIVVPTMNSAATLADALRSLATQTRRDFEVIVSDGTSTDATLAVAQGFAAELPALRIDSRPDTGVYDAINRGVRQARGDWFLVLGGDDRLHSPDTLAVVAPHLLADSATQMVYGDVRMMAVNLCGVPPGGRHAGPMPLQRLFGANLCQQSVFYRRSLFDTLGGFDLRYRLYADWHFNLRTMFRFPTRWIDVVVADYAATGMSATASDAAFLEDLPHLIRVELVRSAGRRVTWPLQYDMVRHARRFRQRGEWKAAFVCIGTYIRLLAQRIPVLVQQVRPRS
jgi:glycosyltransferase involved in cell wall biosynthesis